MNNFRDASIQCICQKFFRTKQTYSLHLAKCLESDSNNKEERSSEFKEERYNLSEGVLVKSEELKIEELKEEGTVKEDETKPVDKESYPVKTAEENPETAEVKSVDELEKEIEQLQEEIDKGETEEAKQEKVITENENVDAEDVHSKSSLDDESETSLEKKPETSGDDINVSNPDLSMESIEIADTDEEEDKPDKSLDVSIDLTEEPETEQLNLASPVVTKPKKVRKKGRAPFKPKPCSYCDEQCHDRIGLAKHLISDHWETVRLAQGGGKLDRSAYYKQIQDSRIIRPKPPAMSARTSFHMAGLAGADSVNKAYQQSKPALQAKNPAWLSKLEIANKFIGGSKLEFRKGLGMNESQNQMSMKQLENYQKYMSIKPKPNPYQLNKRNRNPHSPSWFGKTPTRTLMPKPVSGEVLDLTEDDEPKCDICEDDFNWPDANHACPLKQSKKIKLDKPSMAPVPMKGGLTLPKEKIFKKSPTEFSKTSQNLAQTTYSVDRKQQLEASLKKIPKSTKLVPVKNVPTKTSSGVLSPRNVPTKTLPTRTMPTRMLPTRNISNKNIPERSMGTRTMPSRRVKTY